MIDLNASDYALPSPSINDCEDVGQETALIQASELSVDAEYQSCGTPLKGLSVDSIRQGLHAPFGIGLSSKDTPSPHQIRGLRHRLTDYRGPVPLPDVGFMRERSCCLITERTEDQHSDHQPEEGTLPPLFSGFRPMPPSGVHERVCSQVRWQPLQLCRAGKALWLCSTRSVRFSGDHSPTRSLVDRVWTDHRLSHSGGQIHFALLKEEFISGYFEEMRPLQSLGRSCPGPPGLKLSLRLEPAQYDRVWPPSLRLVLGPSALGCLIFAPLVKPPS